MLKLLFFISIFFPCLFPLFILAQAFCFHLRFSPSPPLRQATLYTYYGLVGLKIGQGYQTSLPLQRPQIADGWLFLPATYLLCPAFSMAFTTPSLPPSLQTGKSFVVGSFVDGSLACCSTCVSTFFLLMFNTFNKTLFPTLSLRNCKGRTAELNFSLQAPISRGQQGRAIKRRRWRRTKKTLRTLRLQPLQKLLSSPTSVMIWLMWSTWP